VTSHSVRTELDLHRLSVPTRHCRRSRTGHGINLAVLDRCCSAPCFPCETFPCTCSGRHHAGPVGKTTGSTPAGAALPTSSTLGSAVFSVSAAGLRLLAAHS
jgi:hypothetical protein